MKQLDMFTPNQLNIVNNSVALAEELVSNFYKMSGGEWLRQKYDIITLKNLKKSETVFGPFAQIVRYVGQRKNTLLGSSTYDFYKICLQDHAILSELSQQPHLRLFPFILYIVTHELIHIVRFSKFLQNFDASAEEKLVEEARVHAYTHQILNKVQIPGMLDILEFYDRWRNPIEGFEVKGKASIKP